MRTTVISVRGRNRDELLKDPRFCYVGRAVSRAGWQESIFGNPFRPTKRAPDAGATFDRWLNGDLILHFQLSGGSRETAERVTLKRRRILEGLPDLRGKTLGCWCCDWDGTGEPEKPCHAVVLARLADSLETAP
jgi:hypothetical protein